LTELKSIFRTELKEKSDQITKLLKSELSDEQAILFVPVKSLVRDKNAV